MPGRLRRRKIPLTIQVGSPKARPSTDTRGRKPGRATPKSASYDGSTEAFVHISAPESEPWAKARGSATEQTNERRLAPLAFLGRQAVVKHKFAVGDRVSVRRDRTNPDMRPGVYTITRILPATAAGLQYRAKNILDSHERVLDEAQLETISSPLSQKHLGVSPSR